MLTSLSNFRSYIPSINSWLLAALFFCIPLHVAPAYNISALMLVLWIIEGNFKQKWIQLRNNPIFWIFQAYFWIFVLSLLWTDNMTDGVRMVRRSTFFLLSPIFLTVARKEHVKRYIGAFLASVAMCEVLAYYNWFRLHFWSGLPIGIMVKKSAGDTAPFVDRIFYAPILAFVGYLAAYKTLHSKGKTVKQIIYLVLFAATVGNLFFSGGRTGQLAFIILMILLFLQHFSKKPLKGAILAIAFTVSFIGVEYFGNSNFRERVDKAIHEVTHFHEMAGQASMNSSSSGLRITFWLNSTHIFLENPFLGVGAGDFTTSYLEMNQRLTPAVTATVNPHNQYLFVITTTGIFGGIILLAAYLPPGFWLRKSFGMAEIKSAFAIFFIFISILESYIWRSNTCLMFIVFSSALYCCSLDSLSKEADIKLTKYKF